MKIRAAQLDDALPMARLFVDTFLATDRGVLSAEALAQRRAAWPYAPFAQRYGQKLADIQQESDKGNRVVDCFYIAETNGKANGETEEGRDSSRTVWNLVWIVVESCSFARIILGITMLNGGFF
jgi:hypothetical protein